MAKPHGSYAKLSKRLRQLGYLCGHPLDHFRCAAAIRRSRLAANPRVTLKYLGDHLALSLRPAQRRMALESHYEIMSGMLRQVSAGALGDGLLIWRKGLSDGQALSITLEPSKLAPMEGELQLRFSFRSDLCVLTFLIAHGEIFGVHQRNNSVRWRRPGARRCATRVPGGVQAQRGNIAKRNAVPGGASDCAGHGRRRDHRYRGGRSDLNRLLAAENQVRLSPLLDRARRASPRRSLLHST